MTRRPTRSTGATRTWSTARSWGPAAAPRTEPRGPRRPSALHGLEGVAEVRRDLRRLHGVRVVAHQRGLALGPDLALGRADAIGLPEGARAHVDGGEFHAHALPSPARRHEAYVGLGQEEREGPVHEDLGRAAEAVPRLLEEGQVHRVVQHALAVVVGPAGDGLVDELRELGDLGGFHGAESTPPAGARGASPRGPCP